MIKFGNDWDGILKEEFEKDYYLRLRSFLVDEYQKYMIYPPKEEIFTALKKTSYEGTKVVILGQDPYHNPGQANGLAFSVKKGIKIPPSLRNIYKEINQEFGIELDMDNGCLIPWTEQGVLLLNTTLTVREKQPNSHYGNGWEIFTDKIIEKLNEREKPVIFVLWGNNAKSKKKYISNSRHYILESVHPSPLSANRGFLGCGHFKRINDILRENGEKEIEWKIKNK